MAAHSLACRCAAVARAAREPVCRAAVARAGVRVPRRAPFLDETIVRRALAHAERTTVANPHRRRPEVPSVGGRVR